MRHSAATIIVLSLLLSLGAEAQNCRMPVNPAPCRKAPTMAAHLQSRRVCTQPRRVNPQPRRICPQPALARPTRTAGGVPIRYVNVPVPNQFGYGYNQFGYGYGYGYGGYGYGYSSGLGVAPVNFSSSSPRRRAKRRAPRKPQQLPQLDQGSAENYMAHKAIADFTSENSLAGKLYLKDGDQKWWLTFHGQPEITTRQAKVPCLGKLRGEDFERPVLLTLTLTEGRVTNAEISPQPE